MIHLYNVLFGVVHQGIFKYILSDSFMCSRVLSIYAERQGESMKTPNASKNAKNSNLSCPYDDDCPVKDQLINAIEIANLGIWEWNVSNGQVILSEEAFLITGIDKTTFDCKMSTITEEIIHLDSREEFKKSLTLAYEEGTIKNNVYRVNHPLLSECWVQFRSQVQIDDAGNPIKISGVIMDVTEDHILKRSLERDLNFVETLLELIPNPIFYKDYLGKYKYFNIAFEKYLGIDKENLFDKTVYDIAPKDLADIYHKADNEILENKTEQVYETKVKYADGSLHDVIFRKGIHKSKNDEALGLIGIMEDVTEQRQLEEKLQMLDQAKGIFLELNNTIMDYTDDKKFLTNALLEFKNIFKLAEFSILISLDETVDIAYHMGLTIPENIDRNSNKGIYDCNVKSNFAEKVNVLNKDNIKSIASDSPIRMLFNSNKLNSAITIPIKIDGAIRWIFCYASKGDKIISSNESEVAVFIREQINVIYRVFCLYKKILSMSRFDGLTGLMNRQYFDENLEKSILIAEKNNEILKIVMFDLDNLKLINDSYGHLAGDQLIIRFTELLKRSFDHGHYFGRIGGDEFVGVFHQDICDELELYLDELRKIFIDNELQFNYEIATSFSYGVAIYPESASDTKGLIKEADNKMYKYKELMKKS